MRRQKKKLEQSQSLLPELAYKEMNEFDAHKQSYVSAQHATEEVPFPKDALGNVENKNYIIEAPDQSHVPFLQENSIMSNGENAKFVQSGQLSTSNRGFNRSHITSMSIGSIVEARKLRESRENDVRKLHNRIALLQSEEEKALKRIEETRAKAQQMLELKIIQEENARERMTNKAKALEKAREIVSSKKEQQLQVRERVEVSLLKKLEMAKMVKEEKKVLKKKMNKNERVYLKKA